MKAKYHTDTDTDYQILTDVNTDTDYTDTNIMNINTD